LLEQRAKLDRQIEAARAEESARDLETVKSLIARWGLTAFECGFVKTQLIPAKREKKSERTFAAQEPKAAPAPKYVNPETGQTWSGRGPQPKWMTGPRDEYLIANADARPNQEARPAMTH
jgi:DNA-binding protein H-NS